MRNILFDFLGKSRMATSASFDCRSAGVHGPPRATCPTGGQRKYEPQEKGHLSLSLQGQNGHDNMRVCKAPL